MLFVRVFSSPFYTLLALKGLHRLISHRKLVLVSTAKWIERPEIGFRGKQSVYSYKSFTIDEF
jgi:hypothetical protein